MTTAPTVQPHEPGGDVSGGGPGERLRRLRRRRRLLREELLALAVLALALAATLAVLGLQWLGSGQSPGQGSQGAAIHYTSGGPS